MTDTSWLMRVEGAKRTLNGSQALVFNLVAAGFAGFYLYTSGFGLVSTQSNRGIYLMLTSVLVFMLFPATRKSPTDRFSLFDIGFVVLTVAVFGYWIDQKQWVPVVHVSEEVSDDLRDDPFDVAAAAVEAETQREAANKVSYAGSVPRCGVVGGTYEFDYLLNFTFAAQHVAELGPDSYPATDFDQAEIDAELWNQPPPTFVEIAIAQMTQQPIPAADPTAAGLELENIVRTLSGGDRPVFEQGFRGPYYHVVMGTGGRDGTVNGILLRNLSGNEGVNYNLDGDPDSSTSEETAFNASMFRVAADPAANPARSDGVRWIPRVNGEFTVPVVTLHGLGDLYVPFVHEQLYRERAETNGSSDMLVQRAVRAPGHCDFTDDERRAAFDAMIAWEQDPGNPPAGDDVSRDAISNENYGCQFTTETRTGVPACPATVQ